MRCMRPWKDASSMFSLQQGSKSRRMGDVDLLAVAEIHVDPARQARVEAADGTHDVDASEMLLAVLLEDGGVLHRVLVGAGRALRVARAGVPAGRRIRVVVGDLALANDHV